MLGTLTRLPEKKSAHCADSYLWWQQGIIYQIYPHSFDNSNGDRVADLRGILGKFDYLQ
jgi:alpha-glucosidase